MQLSADLDKLIFKDNFFLNIFRHAKIFQIHE